jgi:ribosome-binding protein aMBF1 (putative translation factor)
MHCRFCNADLAIENPHGADFHYGSGVATGLVDALAAAARKAREDEGVTRAQVAVALGRGNDTVARFERGEVFTALDDILSAYAEATGASLFDLLDAAKATLKTNG